MRRLVWLCLVGIACGRTEVVAFSLPPSVTVMVCVAMSI